MTGPWQSRCGLGQVQPLVKRPKKWINETKPVSLTMFCLEVVPMTPLNIHLIRHVQSAKAKRNPPLGAWSMAGSLPPRRHGRYGVPECLGRRLNGIIRLISCTDVGCRHRLETRLHHTLPQDRDSGTSVSGVSSHRWSVTEHRPGTQSTEPDESRTEARGRPSVPLTSTARTALYTRLCDATLVPLQVVNCFLLIPSPSARPKHPLVALSPSRPLTSFALEQTLSCPRPS